MVITLFTASGAYNLGDECILLSEYSLLRSRYPQAIIYVATYQIDSVILPKDSNLFYFCPFPYQVRKHWIRNLSLFFGQSQKIIASDMIIIGGGGLFYDNEGGNFFLHWMQWALRIFCARIFRKKIFYWSIGIETNRSHARWLLPFFSGKKTVITVRDSVSSHYLEEMKIPHKIVFDPVFMLQRTANILFPKERKIQKKVLGICLREGYLSNESVSDLLERLSKMGYTFEFLPFSFHGENASKNDFLYMNQWAEKYHTPISQSLSETLERLSCVEGSICMRLHSGILSFIQRIPFFMVSYSKKTDEALQIMQYPYFLKASEYSGEIFLTSFQDFLKEKDTVYLANETNPSIIEKNTLLSISQSLYELEGA